MNAEPFVGLDFGTTYSCISRMRQEEKGVWAELILNADGAEKTPSVAYYHDDGKVYVGEAAERLLEDEDQPQRFVASVKRRLRMPAIPLPDGRSVYPTAVASEIIAQLKSDAEAGVFHHSRLKRVVITHPAVFGTRHQQAVREAARSAGFEEVQLLPEPVAAAKAFAKEGVEVGNGILVYDLGGGTFDLAFVVRDEDGFLLGLEPSGDPHCGGDDFDQALYDYWEDIVRSKVGHGIGQDDDSLDPNFLRKCRLCKHFLSKRNRVRESYFSSSGQQIRLEIERDCFQDLIGPFVDRTIHKTESMLKLAKREGYVIDTVLLIGGSSRIPLVVERLTEALPVKPQYWDRRDFAVALGAAYHAFQLWPPSKRVAIASVTVEEQQELLAKAKRALKRHLYPRAKKLLERIPEGQRSEDVRTLLRSTQKIVTELDHLKTEIQSGVQLGSYSEVLPKVERWLQLLPEDEKAFRTVQRLRALVEQSQTEADAGANAPPAPTEDDQEETPEYTAVDKWSSDRRDAAKEEQPQTPPFVNARPAATLRPEHYGATGRETSARDEVAVHEVAKPPRDRVTPRPPVASPLSPVASPPPPAAALPPPSNSPNAYAGVAASPPNQVPMADSGELGEQRNPNFVYPQDPPLSPNLCWLNCVWPGIAQLFFGQVGKGIVFMIAYFIITFGLPIIGHFALIVVSTIDARQVGRTLSTGVPVGKWQFFGP